MHPSSLNLKPPSSTPPQETYILKRKFVKKKKGIPAPTAPLPSPSDKPITAKSSIKGIKQVKAAKKAKKIKKAIIPEPPKVIDPAKKKKLKGKTNKSTNKPANKKNKKKNSSVPVTKPSSIPIPPSSPLPPPPSPSTSLPDPTIPPPPPPPPASISGGAAALPSKKKLDLKEIKKAVAQSLQNPNKSSQAILHEIVAQIRNTDESPDCEIVTKLAEKTKGKFNFETYTIDGTDQVFYKIQVDYSIKIKLPGGMVKIFPKPALHRTIYTTATSPEQALFAVANFTKVIRELASGTEANFGQLEGMKREEFKKSLIETSFTFRMNLAPNGKPVSLQSMSIGRNSGINFKADKKYVCKKNQVKQIDDKELGKYKSTEVYATEAEAYMHTRYSVTDHIYDRLEKTKTLLQRLDAIKGEVANVEANIAGVKGQFIQRHWLVTEKRTAEFEKFLADVQEEDGTDSSGLDQRKKVYEDSLKSLKSFNKQLMKLNKEIVQLKRGAKDRLSSGATSAENRSLAKKGMSKLGKLPKLKVMIEKNIDFIQEYSNLLTP